jgi:hypothetical protein
VFRKAAKGNRVEERQGPERALKQLEGKSLQEQLEYWQKGTEDLRRLQEKLKEPKGRS